MREWTVWIICAFLVFDVWAQLNPLKDPNICGRPECKESGKFKYKLGTQFSYEYSTNITSLFQGTSRNESTLFITSDVLIDFITPCDGLLTINNARLSEKQFVDDSYDYTENAEVDDEEEKAQEAMQSRSDSFAEALTEYNLRFSFKDGIITELCPHEDEKNWVLNYKRGILSLLHNTMKRFDVDHETVEEDVKGKCKTNYKVQRSKETSLIIEKTKDLDSCGGRAKLHSVIQSTPYNFRPNYQPVDLIKSSTYCELSIDHHIYNDITCEETHLFRPFSNKAAGATTIVRQNLRLIEELLEPVSEQDPVERRTSLLFDQVPSPKPTIGELRTSRDLIKKLCQMSTDDVQMDFSDVFTTFIHTARILNEPTLNALYDHSNTICVTGRRHLLDALPYLGSSASVSLMKDIILQKTVPEPTINDWMVSLALIPRPDVSMMESAFEILKEKQDSHTVALGISSLTHTYCKQNWECYPPIIDLYESPIKDIYQGNKDTRNQREHQEKMIINLKSLANIGVVNDDMKNILKEMIRDEFLDTSVRLAAVEVHRRLPCEESRSFFETVFKDQTEDSEVRIASYLQVMRCPNFVVLKGVLHTLEVEEVNQVGSFIWSHLHNLLKSSVPTNIEIQGLLSNKELKKKFSSDVRKFSQNFEGSVFFEQYNLGANYDSNLIFSTKSYMPKTAMFNMTVEIFGEAVNLFEVYGRFEGFEHYLESIFGPNGKYSSKNLQDNFSVPKMRWSRSIKDNEVLEKQIEKLPNIPKQAFVDPKISLGMKIFGNDLRYNTYNGNKEIQSALDGLNPKDYIMRILSGKEINYSKAAMFLDCSYVIPTSAGLPLSLNAIGTTSVNMMMSGELHAQNFQAKREFDIKGHFKPSVAIDIVGTMSVDAFYANTAIKVKTNMYSSTAIEGDVKVRGSEMVSIKFSLPKKTTEIFGAKSELIVMKEDKEEVQNGIEKNKIEWSGCSWPVVEKTIGLNLCRSYYFTNVTKEDVSPYFILAGPVGARIFIQKADPTAKTYVLQYNWKQIGKSSLASLTLDTPGSSLKRLLTANITMDDTTKNLTLLLQSTSGTMLAEGKYKNTEHDKYLNFNLNINDQNYFNSLVSLQEKQINNGIIFTPVLTLGINGEKIADLSGSVKLVSKQSVSQYDISLMFKTKRMTSKLFGYLLKTEASIGADLKLDYAFENTKSQRVSWYFLLANRSKNMVVTIMGNSALEATAYPNVNFNATLKFKKGQGHMESKLNVVSSPDLKKNLERDPKKITIDIDLNYRTLTNSTRFSTTASLKRPINNLDLGASFACNMVEHDIDVVASVRYAAKKDIIVSVFYSHPKQTLEFIEGRLNISVPGSTSPMIIRGKLKEKAYKDYLVELNGVWFSGHKLEAKGIYQDKSTPKAAIHHLKVLLKSPSLEEINAAIQFHRDDHIIKIDIKADQNKENYGLFFKHTVSSPVEVFTEVRLKYKTQVYSVVSSISLSEKREMRLELHLDQMRDIHLGIWAQHKYQDILAGVEIKWDANRDPNQKLMVTLDMTKPGPLHYKTDLMISYPGRNINGLYEFLLKDGHLSTIARISWSVDLSFAVQLILDYQLGDETLINGRLELITPFEESRRNALVLMYHHRENMYNVSTLLTWQQNQRISVDLFGDWQSGGNDLQCEFKAGISSSIRDIPTIGASIKHFQNDTKVDSKFKITLKPREVVVVTSTWQIDQGYTEKNLTGTVTLLTPFEGFQKGLLVSKVSISNNRDIRGVADLDIDHKKLTASVEAHLRRLSNSMLVFNITTPVENFNKIMGRFGFSEENRHAVAMIHYPKGVVGIEILLQINSISNFDTKFELATPVEFLQEILVVGKLKHDRIDFRTGWNKLLVGFAGIWYYEEMTNFEYSYKVFTPLDGYEENGIVVKLIIEDGLDMELSARLADSRVGVALFGKNKPRILQEMGIKTQGIYLDKLSQSALQREEDEKVNDEDEEEDPLSWSGKIVVDALVYPTVTGEVDIEQKGTLYVLLGTITLPGGKAHIRDEFDLVDIYTITNTFMASTPFDMYKEIYSTFQLEVIMDEMYLLAADFNYKNKNIWVSTGAKIHLLKQEYENGKLYNSTLHLHTPMASFSEFDIHGSLGYNNDNHRVNFTMVSDKSNISFIGIVEMQKEIIDADVSFHVMSPKVQFAPIKLIFKKNFLSTDKYLDFKLDILEEKPYTYLLLSKWRSDSIKNFSADVELETPLSGLEQASFGAEMVLDSSNVVARGKIFLKPVFIVVNATLVDNKVNLYTTVDVNNKRQEISLEGRIITTEENTHEFKGNLITDKITYDIKGNIITHNKLPLNMTFDLRPKKGGSPISVTYQLQSLSTGLVIRTNIRQGHNYGTIELYYTAKHEMDWDVRLRLDSNHPQYKTFNLHGKAESLDGKNNSISLSCRTSLPKLENPRITAFYNIDGHDKSTKIVYDIADIKGYIETGWTWLLFEKMTINVDGKHEAPNYKRTAEIKAFFINPEQSYSNLNIGGNLRLNRAWMMGANMTLQIDGKEKFEFLGNVDVPTPIEETHTFKAKFHGQNDLTHIKYLAQYNTKKTKLTYRSTGDISYGNKDFITSNIDVDWNKLPFNKNLQYTTKENVTDVFLSLKTPKFKEDTFVTKLKYTPWNNFHNVSTEIFYPKSKQLVKADIDFLQFSNMYGKINITNAMKGVNFTHIHFLAHTTALIHDRFVKVSWPKNNAFVDSKCRTTMGQNLLEKNTKGLVLIEVPLQTRHKGRIDYTYREKQQNTAGDATIKYNGDQLVEGKYTCVSESKAGFEKDTVHVEVKNPFLPIGADYIHGFSYSSAGKGSNLPTMDSKYLNLYHLTNKTAFNINGGLNITNKDSGQAIALTATQSNRTVKFWTNYDVVDQELKHHSRLQLGPTAWIAYDLKLLNKTEDDSSEAQQIQFDLSYPKRNFTIITSYNITTSMLTSDVSLKYDHEHPRTVQVQFDWKKIENHPNKQEVQLIFKHPSFKKDVSILGEYSSAGKRLAEIDVTVDYSLDPARLAKVKGFIENHSSSYGLNYTYTILATHPGTMLDLNVKGGAYARPRYYHTRHVAEYTRTYMSTLNGEMLGLLDLANNEIEFKDIRSSTGTSHLYGKYEGNFPMYMVNMSAIYKEINATGKFYVDLHEKLLKLHMNTTGDGSRSIHMYGYIPDSRSIVFDAWREYDDIKETDIAYFLRLNHSRLIVGKLVWRPDLKQSVQSAIRQQFKEMYEDFMENMSTWKQYIRGETVEAITDVWHNAKPLVQEFLDDVKDLSVIEEDFEEFKQFANESYYNNEFYIQDIEKIAHYVIDELALRSHIESLPAIVNEIWDVLGDSGKKIQESIKWIINTIKMYYQNITEFIHGLLQGESLEHISNTINSLVEKYDTIIKDLHVSFIKYIEKLWDQTYIILVDHWHRTLQALEPTFIEFAHYVESFVWNTGNDFIDFLYIRQAEMMESPYFTKFTNFAHDVDRFYRDMTGNDTLASTFKYSKIAYEFLKEKYFAMVPFAVELNEVVMEIVNEIKQLTKLPSVSYFLKMMHDFEASVQWWCDYFELEEKFHRLITVIHLKLTDMQQTALEAENKYREAKTKFIFDTEEGIMYLEQKLPMSWHAFNETPKFEEIPEYKAIHDFQNFFTTSKLAASNLYYDYKPYMDPSDWLPPFSAQAVIAGPRSFITFDRVHYDFQGSCTYLLTSDFIDRNFSIAVKYHKDKTHELIVFVDKTPVHINIFKNTVYYGNDKKSKLPAQFGTTYLYKEADIVTLEGSTGFKLQCNMKFEVCTLELSGWYYGKTAGLWGTMNNEASDDLLSSDKIKLKPTNVDKFAKSWALDTKCHATHNDQEKNQNVPEPIRTLCESFFSAKVSPFGICFHRVPSFPYFDMCLNSKTTDEVCSIALAYMKLCSYENTPMRIPEECVRCDLYNGTTVPEGNFVIMDGSGVPKSADIVFIVEAKTCNKDIRKNRSLDTVIDHIHKELTALSIMDNRYSLVLFGGDGVFDEPRSVSMNDHIFTDHHKIPGYFENLPIGNGNSDIFDAIIYATKLIYRAGVSKTFVLIPCSHCFESDMKLDHAILNQLLLENDIKMHILMNDDFQLQKSKAHKILYGIDQTLAYTRKDADNFTGDAVLKKQVRLPKSTLSICGPLALETHGSVFSAKKLEQNSVAPKLASVFGKRVATSALPSKCKNCECSAYNSGVSYMECLPCSFPTAGGSDIELSQEEMLLLMQPMYDDMDY